MKMRYYPNDLNSLIATASNIKLGENPIYTKENFFAFYPQFENQVPEAVIDSFINLASSNLNQKRWNKSWEFGMALFIAHFLTLYVKTSGTVENPNSNLSAGNVRGIQTSKSVDGVSVSYDVSSILTSMDGWGSYKLTEYGIQLLTMARLLGKGNMYVF